MQRKVNGLVETMCGGQRHETLPLENPIMGRTRTTNTHTRRLKAVTTQASSSATAPPSVPALLAKAQSLVEQCDYQLAARFLQRILETDATHIEARELLGVVQLELGDLDAARLVGPKSV